jgi:hypothetical protein
MIREDMKGCEKSNPLYRLRRNKIVISLETENLSSETEKILQEERGGLGWITRYTTKFP